MNDDFHFHEPTGSRFDPFDMAASTATYGLIGYPLGHSLSPLMHNAAFNALQVDATYRLFPLEEKDLDTYFQGIRKDDCPVFGLNVTVPYKHAVLRYCDSLSPLAEKVQAVNTIKIEEGRTLVGYNTDAPGFVAHLRELGVETADASVAILGAGGSSRAVLASLALLPDGPSRIQIYNRTRSRTDELLKDLGERINLDRVEAVDDPDELSLELTDLLINTTSVGLREDDEPLISADRIHPGLFVYDLIYNPARTRLLAAAEAMGARTANGLGMLYYQGVLALQHWADIELEPAVKNVMREALESAAP